VCASKEVKERSGFSALFHDVVTVIVWLPPSSAKPLAGTVVCSPSSVVTPCTGKITTPDVPSGAVTFTWKLVVEFVHDATNCPSVVSKLA
jgi:hypothetical protein